MVIYKLKLTYRKTGYICYYSHLDISRFLERALRRTQMPYYVTQGFNPHPKISYYGGLKLGLEGENDAVFSFTEDISPDQFSSALQKNFPPELVVVAVSRV